MKRIGVAALSALALMSLAAPANAGILENVQLKFGASLVAPDESADITVIGGDVDISDEVVPSLQIEYFFTDAISAELLCCMARHEVKAVDTALGDVDLGKISHFPPTLTLKYRWNTANAFQPYVGAGVNYTTFFDEDEGAVTSIDYDDSLGGALQGGFDYKLNEHWSLNLDARRIWINSEVTIDAGGTIINADADINPWVITTAVGYRF